MVALLLLLACDTGPAGKDRTRDTGSADTADTADTLDQDGDGYRPLDGDCNDTLPHVYPAAPDFCDGLDQDCDGEPIPDGSCGEEGDATLMWSWRSLPAEWGSTPRAGYSFGDVDGDGLADIAYSQTGVGDGPLYGASLTGHSPWLEPDLLWTERGSAETAGDTNGDGFADAWSISWATPQLLSLQLSSEDGFRKAAAVEWTLDAGVRLADGNATYEGDYDADGAADLLVRWQDHRADGEPRYLALLGGSVGFLGGSDFDAYPLTLFDMGEAAVTLGPTTNVGDLDGDGADEIAVTAHEATGPLDSIAIVSGVDLAAGGGVLSTLAVRSALTTTEYHSFDLTAPSLGANTDANGDGYDDLEAGVSFNDTDFGALLYTSGGMPEGPLEGWTHTRVENIPYSGWVLVRDSDADGDEVADPVLFTNCLLPTTRMSGGGTLDYETIAGPCLGQYAGALRYTSAFADMTGDGLPEWVIGDNYGGEDGNNRVLIVEGFPIPWDDPSKW